MSASIGRATIFSTYARTQHVKNFLWTRISSGSSTSSPRSNSNSSNRRTSFDYLRLFSSQETPKNGPDLYNRAQQYMKDIEEMESQRENERSQAMYKAWQKSQEKGYDSKSQGVKVIKTLAKETRKDLKVEKEMEDMIQKKRDDAMNMLRLAAYEHDHPESSIQLGNMLLNEAKKEVWTSSSSDNAVQTDQQVEEKVQSAMTLFRKAGEGGSRVGWYNLGQILWTGFPPLDDSADEETDVPEEVDERFSYGDDDDNTTTGSHHSNLIIQPDNHEAMECFVKAIDLGDNDAMYLVGVHRLTQGGRENYHSGTNLIKRAAEAGHGGALYYIALLNLNGEPNLGIDPCMEEEFVGYLDRAVDAGSLDARFTRGHSYYHGTEGYSQDFKKALDDFLIAADEGHADAAVSAGAMLHNGVGVLKDQHRAFEMYQLAGELGSEEGWMCVVDCWRNGLGVPKSEETAQHIENTMLKKRKT